MTQQQQRTEQVWREWEVIVTQISEWIIAVMLPQSLVSYREDYKSMGGLILIISIVLIASRVK